MAKRKSSGRKTAKPKSGESSSPKRTRAASPPVDKPTKTRRSKKKREGYSQLVLLGTGTPGPDPERFGSGLAIVVNQQPYLVDFGAGIVRRAAAAYDKGVYGLAPHLLDRAFLTHLHSDHTVGYPDLILTPWVSGRDTKLQVYGPTGIKAMTDHILQAYEADIDQRLNGLEPANEIGYQVEPHEIKPGIIYEDDNVEVEAFSVTHGTFEAYGFKFVCPDRTIVVSGDTCKHDNVAKAAKGCDILVHEVCSSIGVEFRSDVWRTYHSTYHTLAHELAEIASSAKPGLVVLTHQLFQGVSEAELLLEIRAGYSGPVVSGNDLDIF